MVLDIILGNYESTGMVSDLTESKWDSVPPHMVTLKTLIVRVSLKTFLLYTLFSLWLESCLIFHLSSFEGTVS